MHDATQIWMAILQETELQVALWLHSHRVPTGDIDRLLRLLEKRPKLIRGGTEETLRRAYTLIKRRKS